MSQQPTRGRQLPARFDHQSRAEQDIDRIFTQLFPEPVIQPPSRTLRRVVTDGDGGITRVQYVATADPQTGEQNVDVYVQTNKRECSRCGRLVAPYKLHECLDCYKTVCGACLTSRKVFLGDKPVCLTCASLRG